MTNQDDNNTFASLIDGGLLTSEEWGRACDHLVEGMTSGTLKWPDAVAAGLWTLFAEQAALARATEYRLAEILTVENLINNSEEPFTP